MPELIKEKDNEQQEKTVNQSDQKIGYSGTVKIKVVKDKKIISKSTGHNQGSKKLFKFITQCFAGNYKIAESLRPVKIKLFYNAANNEAGAKEGIKKTPWRDGTTIKDCTDFIYCNAAPVTSEEDETGSKVILHFRIPFSYIKSSPINQFCLYSADTNVNEEYSAYYLLTKDSSTDKNTKVLDSIEIDNQQASYNLIVEWELKVDNMTSTVGGTN